MNKTQVLGIVAVLALVSAGIGAYVYTHPNYNFGFEYEDCYLDVTDADKLILKDKPKPGVLGMNVEQTYGGNTLYKSVDGIIQEVEMFKYNSEGEKENVEIDRDIRYVIELSEDAMVVVFYGKESNTNSYELWKAGYSYDPNSQLSYLVDNTTGKMYNITSYTRETYNIKGNEMNDTQYRYAYDKQVGDGYRFIFEKRIDIDGTREYRYLTFTFDSVNETLDAVWGELLSASDLYSKPLVIR